MSAPFALIFLTWLSFGVNLLMAGFLALGLHRILKVRNEIQWEARHFGPLSFSVFFTIIFLAVERNLQLFGSVSGYFDLGTQLRWILNNFFTFGLLCVYGLRAWVVHFGYHTGVATLAMSAGWDTNKEREHLEWFISNKSNYGSPRYLTQFLIVMVIILTLAIWGWIVVSVQTFYYGMVIIYAGIMLVIMTVSKKLTVLDELLFIRRELLLEFRILAGFFVLLGVLIIFGSAMGWDYCAFFVVEASAFAMTGMASVATWWMLDKSDLINLPALMEKRLQELGTKNEDEPEQVKSAPPLRAVLNDEKGVFWFLRHLIRELSLENVYFLADVMHYKHSFVKNSQALQNVSGFTVQIHDLGKYGYVSDRTFVQYAWALSHAYVENVSASYVTAIHSETREKILDYLAELEPQKEVEFGESDWLQLCNVFDQAAEEVWGLLNQSWKRYIRSPHFAEFKMSEAVDRQRTLSTEAARKKQEMEVKTSVETQQEEADV